MEVILIAAGLGILLGAVSYVYEKTFLVLFLLSLPVAFLIAKYPNPVPGFYKVTLPRGNGTQTWWEWLFLPTNNPVQDALLLFPMFFVAARLLTWLYMRVRPTEKKFTRREVISKRNKIYKEHKMNPLYEPKLK